MAPQIVLHLNVICLKSKLLSYSSIIYINRKGICILQGNMCAGKQNKSIRLI